MSHNPYAAPQAALRDTFDGDQNNDPQALYLSRLAHATRFGRAAIWAIAVVTALMFFITGVGLLVSPFAFHILGFLMTPPLGAIPAQIIATRQLVKRLGGDSSQGAFETLLSLLPGLGLIPLVAATKRGARELAKHGVQVGVLGPSRKEVARLHAAVRRALSEEFTYVKPINTAPDHHQTSADTHQA